MGKLLFTDNEWTFDRIRDVDAAIADIAIGKYGMDCYDNQYEIIGSAEMLDAYTSIGMPNMYHHWSYGKRFLADEQKYKRGQMGLAYEIVINSQPTINYLMEENSMTMQTLVIAHAGYGHNNFFKRNFLFREWTDADAIVDYMVFARRFIKQCEEKYGYEKVEETLDSCHALMNQGVDRYNKPRKLSKAKEVLRQQERSDYRQSKVDDLWKTLPPTKKEELEAKKKEFLNEPQENILYFIEKNSPILEQWQREIVRIVRKMAQYFYPQGQTKVMNEGWASFWHHHLMYELWEQDRISDGSMLEFLKSHSGVVFQPDFDSHYFSGFNPYYLGFNIFHDIKRMCEEPTKEDEEWFPDIVGKPWLPTLNYAMENFKDESFILQYLSPALIRKMHLFSLHDNDKRPVYDVNNIHDEYGFKRVRSILSKQYQLNRILPDIQITDFDILGDRTLYLTHYMRNEIPLNKDTDEMLKHIHSLWGFDVVLESKNATTGESIETYGCMKSEQK